MKLLTYLCGLCVLLHAAEAFTVPASSRVATQTPSTTTTTARTGSTALQGWFSDLQGLGRLFEDGETKEAPAPELPLVTIDPDFRIAGLFLVAGLVLDVIPYIQLTLGPLVTLLGVLFLVQTFRIRFIFDNEAIELVTVNSETGDLQSSGENIVVGGANRWDTSTIVNYDFFPKGWIDSSPTGPILVYFKETQTPADKWDEGPGQLANDPEKLRAGAVAGQVHFFPAVANAKQIREQFELRKCPQISTSD